MARGCPRAYGVLLLLAVVQLMGMSLWFTAGALSPELSLEWGLSERQAGWLITVVQLGFVAGTGLAALLNLADIFPAARYFCVSALLAAAANAALLLSADYNLALGLRFLTGLFLAGVYPPAMKMAASWFQSARGFAIGVIVGALTVGKAAPYLLAAIREGDADVVIASSSLACAASGLLVLAAYRDGPYAFERRPFSWRLASTALRHRETRLAILGYLGHMWELYPMWAAIALFFGDYFAQGGGSALQSAKLWQGWAAFGAVAVGGLGAVLAGASADRLGRERVAIWSMAASGACAFAMGWLLNAPPWLAMGVAAAWGFTVIADSAQFSALVTEVAPRHLVGTALTLQTSLGFLLTAAAIWLTFELEARFGWPVAFGALALGPWSGILAMRSLQRLRERPSGA